MRTPQELALLKERAVMLRRQGKSLRQIKQTLGPMSNATLNDALRDEPPPEWTRREDYHGCLRIDAHRSADLYRKIEGWAAGIMAAPHATGTPSG